MKQAYELRIFICMAIGAMLGPGTAMADVIHVPGDAPTIQAGIFLASDGDIVLVAPGTYNEQIDFVGKAIAVASGEGVDVTVIDGSGLQGWSDPPYDGVVRMVSGEGPASVLSGFTITGLDTSISYPTAPVYGKGLRPTILNCVVTGNRCSQSGAAGGICSDGLIINCTVSNNWCRGDGGGIRGTPTVIGCLIEGNTVSESNGGGIAVEGECDIIDCVIVDNRAGGDGRHGGGVYGPARLEKCIIVRNYASAYSAIHDIGGGVDGAISVRNCTIAFNWVWNAHVGTGGGATNSGDIVDSIVWGNYPSQLGGGITGTVTYSCVEGGYSGLGNIASDPLFRDADADDYRLLLGSLCIDTGDPAGKDPDDTRTDMGALFFPQYQADLRRRYGTFLNPPCYSSGFMPEIGTTWIGTVSTNFYGGQADLTAVVCYTNGSSYIMTPAGELLVDPSSTLLLTTVAVPSGGIAQHSIPIPNDYSVVGVWVYTQAVVLGSGPELCNAVDLFLGL